MALILQFLYEYRTAQAESGSLSMNAGVLRHLTVVEEAHRVMSRPPSSSTGEANPQAVAAQLFSDMLSEVRAYGQGFLIVEQVPERLISDAVKNTNLKIVHRIVSKDDRDAMAGGMNLTASQAVMISRLRPGQAVICGDGDDSPCWVNINR
jgi:DNA helicase HerA-like ATPase